MEKLKYAQDLIKCNNSSVSCGFNMFIMGDSTPRPYEYYDFNERVQGYEFAERMAKDEGIAFTYPFKCKNSNCHPFRYGGSFVCNGCNRSGVDKEWWKIKVEKDGNAYCCHDLSFVNLQESDKVAFGDTFKEAIENYGKLMKNEL